MKNEVFSKMPKANQRELSLMLVAVPPLNEQQRIFTKVDELFLLCDGLKEGIGESQKVVNLMADSILEQV
jgi:type I restriction enzyme S subunit